MLVIHSLAQKMVPVYHVRMDSTGMRAPVWTANGMGHCKRLIKISYGIDCYYCINIMTCLIHIYYCSIVLITISNILSTIMSPVYLVTLPNTCCTSCGDTLFMYTYTLHSTYSVSCISCKHCYSIITTQLYGYSVYFISIHSYSSWQHYATVILRLNKKYKVIKLVTVGPKAISPKFWW